MAEMVYGVTSEVTKPGCSIIAEERESYDEILCKRKGLRKGWHIVRKNETVITTSLGDVTYKRTLFKNTKTEADCYLLDKLFGIGPIQECQKMPLPVSWKKLLTVVTIRVVQMPAYQEVP